MICRAVRDHYRCPEGFLTFELNDDLCGQPGYFRFGSDVTCYGRSCFASSALNSSLYDAIADTGLRNGKLGLPFDPTEVIENLRQERYSNGDGGGYSDLAKKAYYFARPLTNAFVRKQMQRFHMRKWRQRQFPQWPVDTTVESIGERLLLMSLQTSGAREIPFVWFWPRGASGCVIMTHDVETAAGMNFCPALIDIDKSFGIRASIQIVPESRYVVPADFMNSARERGLELCVQDLNHDGRLFDDRKEFLRRVARINRYGAEWGAKGFRSAVLYRKPEWFEDLQFSYDMSMPNVAHLDPQHGGCCTVMPYFIGKILELPVTTVQDYMLFHLLNERSIDLWKTQIELILQKNGLVSFIVHPDYLISEDTRKVYVDLLRYLRKLEQNMPLWFTLPREVDSWWRARSQMEVVKEDDSWRIEGAGSELAVLAFAKNVGGKLVYELAESRRGVSSV
jgi:hypothetical protein